ncbi:helix-turn-helix domain-containing protein [Pontibacillus litoralis]|uniref:HTH cro/C1-type domain-containing protein n=1 Tax=Pontibacillus litoralis JSM 072002 TaxID=1385512 RepID=A0A0A5G5H1_9BACI|nr:helix-turn-helix domain-containing protein [Pontibacillus litoralis]KGX88376.1 hypothetical protein N784_06855 [Pontibacillus litoralis JSM 072002]
MEIGSRLKEAREAKKLSLEDVQQETKIQIRYLQAIEQGDFGIMPGKFYTRAFIKQYAEAVGLDPEELFEQHQNEIPSASDDEYIQYTRVQRHKEQSSDKNSMWMTIIPKGIIALLLIGIVVVAYVFLIQSGGDDGNHNAVDSSKAGNEVTYEKNPDTNANSAPPEQDKEDQADKEEDEEEKQKAEEEKEEEKPKEQLNLVEKGSGTRPSHAFELESPEQLKLEFEATNADNPESYLEVRDGSGKVYFSTILNKDNSPQQFDLTGEEQIDITIGRSYQLDMKINGEKVKYPVDPNERDVQEFHITVKDE